MLFQQFINIYIEQSQNQLQKGQEQELNKSLKAKNMDPYYSNLYMKCYYNYQRYKHYFKKKKITGHKYILFTII